MPPVPGHPPRAGVIIPVRAFAAGKARLAGVLDEPARAALGRTLADRVAAAAGALPVLVVSSAPEVRAWADALGLARLDDPGTGLDAAVAAGRDRLAAQGFARVVVAHADLPRARPGALERFAVDAPGMATIVPCHRDDGTPVLALPAAIPFRFAYGPGSSRAHVRAARAAGLAIRVVRDGDLGYDVDVPSDLDLLPELTA
jgi:2-phospho-L-lactate/phosphoenolpyruvate guanylyltransferase